MNGTSSVVNVGGNAPSISPADMLIATVDAAEVPLDWFTRCCCGVPLERVLEIAAVVACLASFGFFIYFAGFTEANATTFEVIFSCASGIGFAICVYALHKLANSAELRNQVGRLEAQVEALSTALNKITAQADRLKDANNRYEELNSKQELLLEQSQSQIEQSQSQIDQLEITNASYNQTLVRLEGFQNKDEALLKIESELVTKQNDIIKESKELNRQREILLSRLAQETKAQQELTGRLEVVAQKLNEAQEKAEIMAARYLKAKLENPAMKEVVLEVIRRAKEKNSKSN